MKIQVLGSGCSNCKNLYDLTVRAIKELGQDDQVFYITGPVGIQLIVAMGVMQSPVLAIDGKPVLVGFTPDIEKIKNIIKTHIK